MTYFSPAGGGGIGMLAVAAKSSKLAGLRLFPASHLSNARSICPKSGPAFVFAARAAAGTSVEGVMSGWEFADGSAAAGCAGVVSATACGAGISTEGDLLLLQPAENKTAAKTNVKPEVI